MSKYPTAKIGILNLQNLRAKFPYVLTIVEVSSLHLSVNNVVLYTAVRQRFRAKTSWGFKRRTKSHVGNFSLCDDLSNVSSLKFGRENFQLSETPPKILSSSAGTFEGRVLVFPAKVSATMAKKKYQLLSWRETVHHLKTHDHVANNPQSDSSCERLFSRYR